MNTLAPHLPFDERESPLGFAARLAAFHAGSRTGPFLRDIGIGISDLARGRTDAIQKLAEKAGVDPDLLGANAAQCLDRRHFELRGENVSAEFLASPYTAFCPKCLLADDESGGRPHSRRHRWIWQLRVVRTCPDHGLPLVRRMADYSGDRFHELAIMVPETGDCLRNLIGSVHQRPVSPLQDYVLKRLAGMKGPNWLDGEGIDQAVRATEMLGVLKVFGAKPNLDKLTEDDRDRAGEIGFAFTAQGEDGIRQALSEVQASVKETSGKQGPQHAFGRLYQWLAQSRARKEPGDIKRILREHIVETMAVPAGGVVLGQKLSERRLHTCATLARETGLDPRTLRGLLAAKGLIPEDQSAGLNHVFDARRGEQIAQSMRRLVPLTTLPKTLGCSRPLAEDLVSERILTPIVSEASYAPGRMKKAVDAAEITGLLKRLEAEVKLVV
ncbi:TniQ family protein [Seohaeicola sp. SP36]|uniref:TniQ family protein n=1 Tax=Seohaeicola sp. SP36 TaxID=3028380 RepID=UPI00237A6AB3|nr:TniQ family protein [Seohaeicola sp. SP36]MDD9738016.1 TniQ family protein [Seohaeicola sp. SP36]